MKSLRIVVLSLVLAALAYAQQPINNAQVAGNATVTAATGVQKVGIVGNAGAIFDAAGQNAASPANEILVGAQFNTSPTTISSGNMSPLQVDSGGKLLVNCTGCAAASTVSLVPQTSGGLAIGGAGQHFVAAASNNATNLKASAGQLYAINVYNNAGYPVYLKFQNKATSPTCGTDTNVLSFGTQAGTQREFHTEEGIAFGTGIDYCLVKGIADNDNTSVAASDATVDILFK